MSKQWSYTLQGKQGWIQHWDAIVGCSPMSLSAPSLHKSIAYDCTDITGFVVANMHLGQLIIESSLS